MVIVLASLIKQTLLWRVETRPISAQSSPYSKAALVITLSEKWCHQANFLLKLSEPVYQNLRLYYFPAKKTRFTLIASHGFSPESWQVLTTLALNLNKQGISLVVPDARLLYSALGTREWQATLLAGWWAQQNASVQDWGWYGVSQGSSAVLRANHHWQNLKLPAAKKIILSAPFASIPSIFRFQLNQYISQKRSFYRKAVSLVLSCLLLPQVLTACFFGIRGWFYSPLKLVTTLNTPLLVLGGKYDDKVNPDDAKLLVQKKPNAQLKQLETGHWLYGEKPEEYTQLITSFIFDLD